MKPSLFLVMILLGTLVIAPVNAIAAGNNWMATIGDRKPLTGLSIPGTHDSCALSEPVPGTAKCQDLTLAQQLNAGVRFLDIRCNNTGKAFSIYHGVYPEGMTFAEVVTTVTNFLRANPTETVIMSIKEENSHTGAAFDTVFKSYVAKNPSIWHLGSSIPTLGPVRGKIVLFRRFAGTDGIDASQWPDNTTFAQGKMLVEDNYNIPSVGAKWSAIAGHLDAAKAGASATLYLTFTSGYIPRMFGIPNITAVSDSVNSNLTAYFNNAGPGRYGIIPMDFVDAAHCAQIIATNPP